MMLQSAITHTAHAPQVPHCCTAQNTAVVALLRVRGTRLGWAHWPIDPSAEAEGAFHEDQPSLRTSPAWAAWSWADGDGGSG